MKHVIIAGAPRSGKTTLSRMLRSYYPTPVFTHYKMDSIKRVVFDTFCPENKDWHYASEVVAKMIKKICDDNAQESSNPEYIIFDSPHLYPKDLVDFDRSKFLIVFLGYTDISVEKKAAQILEHDAPSCWTRKLKIPKLKSLIEGNIAFSQEIKKQCAKYGFYYFDTSHNMYQSLIEILNFIVHHVE